MKITLTIKLNYSKVSTRISFNCGVKPVYMLRNIVSIIIQGAHTFLGHPIMAKLFSIFRWLLQFVINRLSLVPPTVNVSIAFNPSFKSI